MELFAFVPLMSTGSSGFSQRFTCFLDPECTQRHQFPPMNVAWFVCFAVLKSPILFLAELEPGLSHPHTAKFPQGQARSFCSKERAATQQRNPGAAVAVLREHQLQSSSQAENQTEALPAELARCCSIHAGRVLLASWSQLLLTHKRLLSWCKER